MYPIKSAVILDFLVNSFLAYGTLTGSVALLTLKLYPKYKTNTPRITHTNVTVFLLVKNFFNPVN